jgi:hypothetical protein
MHLTLTLDDLLAFEITVGMICIHLTLPLDDLLACDTNLG